MCVRHREFLQAASTQELDRNRGLDAGGLLPSRVQVLEPSVGEERAVLLGFSMMAFSVLMLFVVGVTTVQPYLSRYCRARTSQSGHVFFLFWKARECPWNQSGFLLCWRATTDC